MDVRTSLKIFLILAAFAVASYAAVRFAPMLALILPRSGRVLEFKITKTSDDGPERAFFVEADVAPDAGSVDDFAATAVALASALPGDKVIVSIERSDVEASVDRWRRTLARAAFRRTDDPPWYVSTVDPVLPANEIAASNAYSTRAGLALTTDGEPLSATADSELVKQVAAQYSVTRDRVTVITTLRHERGDRSDWKTLTGPGSPHLDALAKCYADNKNVANAWKDCR